LLRILHVAALPFPSHQGTQVYIRQLCGRQAVSGHDVHLLTYAHGDGTNGRGGFDHHRIPDFPRYRSLRSGPSWHKPLLDASLAAATRRLTSHFGVDVVHAHHYEGLAASLAALPDVPVVYHAHTLLEPELPCYFRHVAARTGATLVGLAGDRLLPRLAAHCMVISPYLREVLVGHGVSEDRVTYVPPALEDERDTWRGCPDAGRNGPVLLYLGNLDRYQGIELMLEGFVRILRRHPRARLRVVTDSDPTPCLRLAASLSVREAMDIQPHGDFSSVLPRMLSARVALVPRCIPGGFPIKLLNYLHGGLPVVASTHGSGGLRHGVEAMVFQNGDELVEHTCRLLDDPAAAARIGRAGRAFARAHFSWETALARMDRAYARVLRRPGSQARGVPPADRR
jgi:glycosyltransferase involved in cell wall biosynthesis